MSFNMWQKLMAATHGERRGGGMLRAAAAEGALTGDWLAEDSAKPSRATSRTPRSAAAEGTPYNSTVAHVIEPASSGRAKCRSCDQPIAKGELRFGERQPNAFGDGEMTLWFHLPCAAYSRPEPFLEAHGAAPDALPSRSRPRPASASSTAASRACTAPSARRRAAPTAAAAAS